MPGDAHEPAHALGDLVEPGAIAIEAGLAEAGGRREHDPRVHGRERVATQAEPALDVWPVVLDHGVGRPPEVHEDRPPGLVLQVHSRLRQNRRRSGRRSAPPERG